MKDSFDVKVLKSWIWKFFFGSFGSTMAFLFLGKNLDNSITLLQSIGLGIALFSLILGLLLIYYLTKELIELLHKRFVESVWGMAIVKLKDAYANIHHLRKLENIDEKEFLATMIELCDMLKDIFDKKTRENCCVSIKVPVKDTQDLMQMEVRNLCRDSLHPDRDTRKYEEAKHTVINNTAYLEVVRGILNQSKNLEYVNNDIINTRDYHNTSQGCYTQGELPYKSELVYPILPIRRQEKNYKMCGFICIDCNKENAFDKNLYDVAMVQGVSDGIYDIMVKMSVA